MACLFTTTELYRNSQCRRGLLQRFVVLCSCRLLVHRSRGSRRCPQQERSYETCCVAARKTRITSTNSEERRPVTQLHEWTNTFTRCGVASWEWFQRRWMCCDRYTLRNRRVAFAAKTLHSTWLAARQMCRSFESCGLQPNMYCYRTALLATSRSITMSVLNTSKQKPIK